MVRATAMGSVWGNLPCRVSRYLFENPWPGAVALVLLGLILLWRARADGGRRVLLAGLSALTLAGLLLALAALVTTPGEHGRSLVRRLVDAAEAGDVAGASALFEPDATINFDRPDNPSMGRSVIDRGLASLADRHRVESNSVSRLRGTTVDGRTGSVELSCWTQTASSMGNIPSQWIFRVRQQPDGSWLIDRMTCVSIAGRQVGSAVW